MQTSGEEDATGLGTARRHPDRGTPSPVWVKSALPDQFEFARARCRLESRRDAELPVQVLQVGLHGVLGHDEVLGDLAIRHSSHEQTEDLLLPRSQRLNKARRRRDFDLAANRGPAWRRHRRCTQHHDKEEEDEGGQVLDASQPEGRRLVE